MKYNPVQQKLILKGVHCTKICKNNLNSWWMTAGALRFWLHKAAQQRSNSKAKYLTHKHHESLASIQQQEHLDIIDHPDQKEQLLGSLNLLNSKCSVASVACFRPLCAKGLAKVPISCSGIWRIMTLRVYFYSGEKTTATVCIEKAHQEGCLVGLYSYNNVTGAFKRLI